MSKKIVSRERAQSAVLTAPVINAGGEAPPPEQPAAPAKQTRPEAIPGAPTTGRAALRSVQRELSDKELASPGARKLLLDNFEKAEIECEDLTTALAKRNGEYERLLVRFYEKDTRASVLEEQLKRDKTNEILVAVGFAVGGALFGVAPAITAGYLQWLIAGLGVALMAGAAAGRYRQG